MSTTKSIVFHGLNLAVILVLAIGCATTAPQPPNSAGTPSTTQSSSTTPPPPVQTLTGPLAILPFVSLATPGSSPGQERAIQKYFASRTRIRMNGLLKANGIEVVALDKIDALDAISGLRWLDDECKADGIRRLAEATKAKNVICCDLHGYGRGIKAGLMDVATYQLFSPEMLYAFSFVQVYDSSARLLFATSSVAGVTYQHGLLDPRGIFERLGILPDEGIVAEQAYAEAATKPLPTWFGRKLAEVPENIRAQEAETACKSEWLGGAWPERLVTFRTNGDPVRFTPPARLAQVFLATKTKLFGGLKVVTDPVEEKFTSLAKKHGYTLVPAEKCVNYTIPNSPVSSSPTAIKPPKNFYYPSAEERSVTNLLAIARTLKVDGLVLMEGRGNYILAKAVATGSGSSWQGAIHCAYANAQYKEAHEQMGQILFDWINRPSSGAESKH